LNRLKPFKNRDGRRLQTNCRVVSFLSGKGGVGKSVLSFNMADRLAGLGRRVLLVDADFGFGNIHLLANKQCDYGIGHFMAGQLSLKEAVISINGNFDILASVRKGPAFEQVTVSESAGMVQRLTEQGRNYDLILIDHGSGISEAATIIANGSDLIMLVMVPELTSISDAYGLYKLLLETNSDITCGVLLNRTGTDEDEDYISKKFGALTERFLGRVPMFLGSIAENELFRKSIAAQKPVAAIDTDSVVVQPLTELCRQLCRVLFESVERLQLSQEKTINNIKATADIKE